MKAGWQAKARLTFWSTQYDIVSIDVYLNLLLIICLR